MNAITIVCLVLVTSPSCLWTLDTTDHHVPLMVTGQPETRQSSQSRAGNNGSDVTTISPVGEDETKSSINATFNGCYDGSKTYQIGEVFFDGCAYKCTCHEGGIRECSERCPVYIDTIGYERCEWQSSPLDSCCTIPVCPGDDANLRRNGSDDGHAAHGTAGGRAGGKVDDESGHHHLDVNGDGENKDGHHKSPSSANGHVNDDKEAFCIANGQVFAVNQTWRQGEGCARKECTCLYIRANGSTIVDCKGTCATIPASALEPTIECPKPELVTPDDACICPYVVCNPVHLPPSLPDPNQLSPARKADMGSNQPNDTENEGNTELLDITGHHDEREQEQRHCSFKGKKIPIGTEVYDGCKAVCRCDNDGDLSCALVECPHHFGAHVTGCLEWDIEADYEPTPPNCCPEPKCKNDGSCDFAGLRVPNFKAIPQELLPCGTSCACVNGNMTCENKCPPLADIPPPSLPCPASLAHRGHSADDSCCLRWLCREPERPAVCLVNGKQYKINDQWDDVATGLSPRMHRRCQCKAPGTGNGSPRVECRPGKCPQITDRHLRPSPECPVPVIVAPEGPAIMCPYVVCNHTYEETGKDLDRVSVVAMNSTAVRIRFSLPQILVGLVGHAELHNTRDPSLPRDQWAVQKFARPKRLFDTANIEYHLGRLRPDTVYFFQIRVVVEALHGGPESEIYRLKMPPLPTASPTSAPEATGPREPTSGPTASAASTTTTSTTLAPPTTVWSTAHSIVSSLPTTRPTSTSSTTTSTTTTTSTSTTTPPPVRSSPTTRATTGPRVYEADDDEASEPPTISSTVTSRPPILIVDAQQINGIPMDYFYYATAAALSMVVPLAIVWKWRQHVAKRSSSISLDVPKGP
ncbi:putative epidermal cell surface receptor [Halotydeus destructor]|nr:putative epidermal cell surface receptor [Halotydeus destructor]